MGYLYPSKLLKRLMLMQCQLNHHAKVCEPCERTAAGTPANDACTGRTLYHTTTFMCQGWRTDPGVPLNGKRYSSRYRALLLTDVPFFPAVF